MRLMYSKPSSTLEYIIGTAGTLLSGIVALLQGPYATVWALGIVWLLEVFAGMVHELDDGRITCDECRHYILAKLIVWPALASVFVIDKVTGADGLVFAPVCLGLLFTEFANLVKHVSALNPAAAALIRTVEELWRKNNAQPTKDS